MPKQEGDLSWENVWTIIGQLGAASSLGRNPLWPHDFPHNRFHIAQATVFALAISSSLRLSPIETLIAVGGTLLHDEGYMAVAAGTWPPRLHHLSGAMRAAQICEKLNLDTKVRLGITQAVTHHAKDVLPTIAPISYRVLIAADRAAGMGPSGFVRDAYYLGFRHLKLEDNDIWNYRKPSDETKITEFCRRNVLPYLVDNKLIAPMLARCFIHLSRFQGLANLDKTWAIEPILPQAQWLFFYRLLNTFSLTRLLRNSSYT